MTVDSVPAPMVQIPAAELDELREKFRLYAVIEGPLKSPPLTTIEWAAHRLLLAVDAATPAASVPAVDILALADDIARQGAAAELPVDHARLRIAERLRALVAADSQPEGGKGCPCGRTLYGVCDRCSGTPTPPVGEPPCVTCGHERTDHHWVRGAFRYTCRVGCSCTGGFTPPTPAAEQADKGDEWTTCTHGNDIRIRCEDCEGWTDMGDPDPDPAPTARVPVNDEAEAELNNLRRWKAEAMQVMDGLQDLGKELGLPLGEQVTGPKAVEAVRRLLKATTEGNHHA